MALGLPFLEAMTPTARAGGAGGPPKRFVAIFTPNGMPMNQWTPSVQGSGYDLPPALVDLAGVENDTLVLSNLQIHSVDGSAGHAPGTAGFLTCTAVNPSETELTNATSVDQLFADSIAGQTATKSLQLGMIGGGDDGGCDAGGYGCAYLNNISWVGNTPLPKLSQPQAAFDLLFAGYDPGASTEELVLRRTKRLSVLDAVLEEATTLQAALGTTDQAKVEEYLDAVRDLELRVESEDIGGPSTCTPTGPDVAFDIDQKTEAMLDIMAMAFECDRTRAITFMLGQGLNSLDFHFLTLPDGQTVNGTHHSLSHALGAGNNAAQYLEISRWQVRKFASLLGKLRDIDEGGSTVLDNSIVYFGNGISSGSAHDHVNMPILVGGHGGGTLSSGRHIHYGGAPPVANLFIALLNALDVPTASFGDDGVAPLGQLGG